MTSKTPCTGNQHPIHYGDYFAAICELGARARRFSYRGKEIFCSLGTDNPTPTCNGYMLAPQPNRVENGKYDFNDKYYCVPVNEYHPAPCSDANHECVYHYMWKLEPLTDSIVTLSLRSPSLDGYPLDVTVAVIYELGNNGMTATVNARNDGDEPALWALGLHPWLVNDKQDATVAECDADSAACHLQTRVTSRVTVDEALIPTGTGPVAGTRDLNGGPTFEGRAFDDAWVDIERTADGTTITTFIRLDDIEVKIIDDEAINT